uniref:Uncharacterized protein n=1 Tax=Coccolithus braarudii TaxID=221442 RepID=A0A7S0LJY6_9EUKA|mmetsp:Transcript_44401/g.94461  ORF Transcript_44401/g.94461 Transcript_44401/m.94461 type:complete len:161 (+) Transcript_44401:382-864(+)
MLAAANTLSRCAARNSHVNDFGDVCYASGSRTRSRYNTTAPHDLMVIHRSRAPFGLLLAHIMPAGKPALNPDVNPAVKMVANGMTRRNAWLACGRPNGEKGIQTIGQRGRALKRARLEESVAEPAAELPVVATPAAEQSGPTKRRKVYSNAKQTEHLNRH